MMQKDRLVPKQRNGSQCGAQHRLAQVDVRLAVLSELILDGIVHGAKGGDRLAHLIAQRFRLF